MNMKNPVVRFFWLPILLLKGAWLLIKIMLLAFIHADDCRECEHQMYRNPRKVTYSMRQGMQLTYLGQWLFAMIVFIVTFIVFNFC